MKTPSRKIVGAVAMTLLVGALGVTAGVFVARPAEASSAKTTTKKKTTTKPSSTKATTTKPTATTATTLPLAPGQNPLAAKYFVLNGTVHSASDHEILGSSAFPNFSSGAVDNYYSMAHAHVDNSPFAEGTGSPFDTGPIGQTVAAGNFQQTQYADARWPGNSGKASYGTKGQPYAAAEASEYKASSEASLASSELNAPGGPSQLATPKGFDGKLKEVLAGWKAKWQGRLHPKAPVGPVKTPVPTPTVKTPTVPLPTPVATVTTPALTVAVPDVAPPPVSAPAVPAAPPAIAPHSATPTRSMSSASTAPPADGASHLESSSLSTLDPKTGALVTSGESRLGRVSLGGGQIVIEGIHVTASIANDGTPTYKAAVSIASATIGGTPVTIDQDGVHVAGQDAGLPYQQASDSLNTALKQAGIQLFLVSPEVKKGGSCDQSGTGGGTAPTGSTTTMSTTTSSNDQSSPGSSSSSCDQSGMTSTTSSCDQSGTTTGSTTTNATPNPLPGTTTGSTTTNKSGGQTTTTSTTSTTSSCGQTDTTSTGSSCTTGSGGKTSTAGTTTTPTSSTDTGSTTTGFGDGTGTTGDSSGANEESVTATGLHVVFTQPVSQSGVPAQYAEHILGEVFLDSLAVPAGKLPDLNLSSSASTSLFSSCPNGSKSGKVKASSGGSIAGSGSSAAGSSSTGSQSGSLSSGSSQPTSGVLGGSAQPTAGTTGGGSQSFPARVAAALRKPLWLLLAYLIWQALVIGTGASLWSWKKEDVA